MDIMRRIDQVIAATADAYVKELQEEIARLREALVEERRKHVFTMDEMTWPEAQDAARRELIAEGLLPPD